MLKYFNNQWDEWAWWRSFIGPTSDSVSVNDLMSSHSTVKVQTHSHKH